MDNHSFVLGLISLEPIFERPGRSQKKNAMAKAAHGHGTSIPGIRTSWGKLTTVNDGMTIRLNPTLIIVKI